LVSTEEINRCRELEDLIGWFTEGDPLIDIATQFQYSSGILLGSLSGDITLGLIRADAVIAAALGGSIWDATNEAESVIGDVYANYLGLLARYDIGTSANPINTFVNILSAYSWDTGNIYINNIGKSLQLGLYLPIYALFSGDEEGEQIGALGASVAANNGIIHVVSDGDIIVNSVISPRGGVYLETTDGSIYAGRGWCPVVSQSDLDGLPFSDFIGEALMGMDGTEWNLVAGVDYFSPVMFALMPLTGTNDLPLGPNVIAGGYSYFSAINGTIGVGAYNDLLVGLFDNPLKVDIQVLSGNLGGNNSALPGGGTAVAGLTLKIGGGKGSYNDGYNGSLPVSGVIEGLVRPGTTMNGVNPSPALDLTGVTTGYVFYNDSDTSYGKDCPGCTITLDGSSVRNRGLEQIYPDIPSGFGNLINQLAIDPRIRNIYHPSFRTVSIDRQTPTGTYFYHPLVLSDSSAFDEIALNAGAYDFIDGNLDLKGDNTFSPFYQNDNGKKKNKGKG
ncbi:MAG TPA: hypothetical protein PKI44_04275, partial [Candidatus Omnitrophota bacterium]|nr:hypothetical protein [Candidatus Omnitrophota bacterium]